MLLAVLLEGDFADGGAEVGGGGEDFEGFFFGGEGELDDHHGEEKYLLWKDLEEGNFYN